MTINFKIRDEPVVLLPEKLVLLPAIKALLVADTHFGKAATFRKAGIPVPFGTTQTMLNTLSRAITKHAAERMVVLGDFVHSATRAEQDFESELKAWRTLHPDLALTLVAGNHDRGHSQLFAALDINVVSEPLLEPPFAFCHFHQANRDEKLFTFAGHIHPAARIPSRLNENAKVPCFAFSERVGILPAFGEFTGTAVVSANEFPNLYVVADNEIIDISRKQPAE